jgi:hypothetical protein
VKIIAVNAKYSTNLLAFWTDMDPVLTKSDLSLDTKELALTQGAKGIAS